MKGPKETKPRTNYLTSISTSPPNFVCFLSFVVPVRLLNNETLNTLNTLESVSKSVGNCSDFHLRLFRVRLATKSDSSPPWKKIMP